MRSFAAPRLAKLVVQEIGPIHANANSQAAFDNEIAPGIVDQSAVGLEGVGNRQLGSVVPGNNLECFSIEGGRKHQRFTRVPYHRERLSDQPGTEDFREHTLKNLGGNALLREPIGEIAIAAIEVAE